MRNLSLILLVLMNTACQSMLYNHMRPTQVDDSRALADNAIKASHRLCNSLYHDPKQVDQCLNANTDETVNVNVRILGGE